MKNIFIAIIVIVMLPLLFASLTEKESSQELRGFTARDIQYIESIGFVDNLDGSWTLTLSGLTTSSIYYVFDFQPTTNRGKIDALRIGGASTVLVLVGEYNDNYSGGTLTLWGGDVS